MIKYWQINSNPVDIPYIIHLYVFIILIIEKGYNEEIFNFCWMKSLTHKKTKSK